MHPDERFAFAWDGAAQNHLRAHIPAAQKFANFSPAFAFVEKVEQSFSPSKFLASFFQATSCEIKALQRKKMKIAISLSARGAPRKHRLPNR
jgi:hypothetical protein